MHLGEISILYLIEVTDSQRPLVHLIGPFLKALSYNQIIVWPKAL